jgi:hypothetical protein
MVRVLLHARHFYEVASPKIPRLVLHLTFVSTGMPRRDTTSTVVPRLLNTVTSPVLLIWAAVLCHFESWHAPMDRPKSRDQQEANMKRVIAIGALVVALFGPAAGTALAAPNPSGTGPPSQTCLSSTAPSEPGNASSSPGSPFNEPVNGSNGGTGGAHYNANSQYDVACYQVSQNH